MTNLQSRLKIKISLCFIAFMFIMNAMSGTVYALADGAYTVPVSVSYANPETGQIVDGGTNVELGESMVTSVVAPQALVEVSNGRTYVTIGIGLASNISNPRILVQNQRGVDSFSGVSITQTGTSIMHDDTCLHFRFPMSDPNLLISPVIFVDPMGRDVQFFIRLNMGSATAGTGIFLSEMVAVNEEVIVNEVLAETEDSQVEDAVQEEETEDSQAESTVEEETEEYQPESDVEEEEDEVEEEPERERRIVDIQEVSLDGVVGLSIHKASEEESKESEESGNNIPVAAAASFGALFTIGGGVYIFQKKKGAS